MTVRGVEQLSPSELKEFLSPDPTRVKVDDATYTFIRKCEGVDTYRSIDRQSVMGIVEVEGETFRITVGVRVSERWVFDTRDSSRASRHIAKLVLDAKRAAAAATA